MTLFRHPQVILASFGEERLSFAAVEQVVEQCWEEGEALRKEGRRQVRRERERDREERLSFAAVEQVVEQCWEEGEALRKEGRPQGGFAAAGRFSE
jgi:hypothetical protein